MTNEEFTEFHMRVSGWANYAATPNGITLRNLALTLARLRLI